MRCYYSLVKLRAKNMAAVDNYGGLEFDIMCLGMLLYHWEEN